MRAIARAHKNRNLADFEKALRVGLAESKTKEFHFTEGSMYAYWRAFEYMYTGSYSNEALATFETQGRRPQRREYA